MQKSAWQAVREVFLDVKFENFDYKRLKFIAKPCPVFPVFEHFHISLGLYLPWLVLVRAARKHATEGQAVQKLQVWYCQK
ncbi:hypothetical protein ScPMuIL_014502 [Solemya velum]